MKRTSCKKNRGFNLLEVMIALFVLAIGMLGILKMQAQAAKHNKTAYLYSQAGFYAQDIVERMRANKTQANQYTSTPPTTTTDCSVNTADCSASQLAAWDLKEWSDQLKAGLPLAESEIQVTGSLSNEVRVAIRFSDRSEPPIGSSVQPSLLEYVIETEL